MIKLPFSSLMADPNYIQVLIPIFLNVEIANISFEPGCKCSVNPFIKEQLNFMLAVNLLQLSFFMSLGLVVNKIYDPNPDTS